MSLSSGNDSDKVIDFGILSDMSMSELTVTLSSLRIDMVL